MIPGTLVAGSPTRLVRSFLFAVSVLAAPTSTGNGAGLSSLTLAYPPYVRAATTLAVVVVGAEFVAVGDTTTFHAVVRDSMGTLLNDRKLSWTTSDPSIAQVSRTGLVTGLHNGDVAISASLSDGTGRRAVKVLTTYTDQKWDAMNGWEFGGGIPGGTRVVSSADSPFADKHAVEYRMPAGMLGGGGSPSPASANWYFDAAKPPAEILVSAWIKLGTPYQAPPSLGQKLWYVQDVENPRTGRAGLMWTEYYGTEDDGHVTLVNQMSPETEAYEPNVSVTKLTAGTWHKYEMYFKQASTLDARDGVVKVWVDDVLNISRDNVPGLFYGVRGFHSLHQNMQWGGGGVLGREQLAWATHNRVSGR